MEERRREDGSGEEQRGHLDGKVDGQGGVNSDLMVRQE